MFLQASVILSTGGGASPNFRGGVFFGGFLQISRGVFFGGFLQIFRGGSFLGGSFKFSGGVSFVGGPPNFQGGSFLGGFSPRIWSTFGRYESYWNAFFFLKNSSIVL